MPRKRAKPKKKRQQGLAENQACHLVWGFSYPFLSGPTYDTEHDLKHGSRHGFPFRDEAERERLWFENREELLACVGRRHDTDYEPPALRWGERPDGWWCYEAIRQYGMRRLIAGSTEWFRGKMWRGTWSGYSGGWPKVESQFAYLKRNNLLFDGEEEKVIEAEQERRKKDVRNRR